jgi:hypothetical protein
MILPSMRTLFKSTTNITPHMDEVHIGAADESAAMPYVLLTEIENDFSLRLDGTGGLILTDVDVDCKAATYNLAQTLADAVKAYFQDYTGAAGTDTVKAVLLNGEKSDYEPPQDGSSVGKHVVTLDFNVQWST